MPESETDLPSRRRAVELHPEAEAELRRAVRYYEEQRDGLGEEFLDEIQHATSAILDNPASGPSLGGGLRWILARRFPYGVIYRQPSGSLEILAVAHLRRRPGYWRHRVARD